LHFQAFQQEHVKLRPGNGIQQFCGATLTTDYYNRLLCQQGCKLQGLDQGQGLGWCGKAKAFSCKAKAMARPKILALRPRTKPKITGQSGYYFLH